MKSFLYPWIVTLLVALPLRAGNHGPDYVSVTSTPQVTVAAGKPALASLTFHVIDGFHINSNQPKSDLLIPTKLKLEPQTDLVVDSLKYPEGKELSLSFDPKEKPSVYSGDFTVLAKFSAAKSATPGRYRVHGELNYQACSDRACYPPKKLPISVDVTVLKSRLPRDHVRRNPAQSPHIHS